MSVATLPMDTVDWNGNTYLLQYNLVVENIGNMLLNGGGVIQMRYNGDSTTHDMAFLQAGSLEVGQQDTIGFVDTISTITGNRYKGGDNILVIWPKADNPNALAPDTSIHEIHIVDLTLAAKDPIEFKNRLQIYPNPVAQSLNLQYLEAREKLEYVRISTLEGKVLLLEQSPLADVSFASYPEGMYLLEVRYRDGVKGTFRVIHQN